MTNQYPIIIVILLVISYSCLPAGMASFVIRPAYAVTNPQSSGEITNSTTIPDSTVSIPHLRSPANDFYTTNFTSLLFSWQRSTCDTGIDHYSVYRDDIIIADGITHADIQATSVYTASVDSGYVYLTFKAPISEGTHTWKVIAVGSEGNTASSETWTFTVDHTIPDIILTTVDKNKMYWATHDPATIPPWDQRQLIVTASDPLISGKVEANSNIKFSLSTGQTIIIYEADGNWEHRFRGLEKNVTYSVFITATDAAGNTNSFPEFTIQAKPDLALPDTFRRPQPSVIPTQYPVIPTVPSVISKIPRIPAGPTPPIPEFRLPPPPPAITAPAVGGPAPTPSVIPSLIHNSKFIILFGLLLHLAMTFFGAGIHLTHLPGFLYTLCFPFIGKKTYEIDPFFTTITIFDPVNLSHEFFSWVSNIKGKINLEFPNPRQIFLQLTRPGYEKQSLLLASAAIPEGTVIKLKPKDHPSRLERLETFSLSMAGLPLIIADLTSLTVLILAPSIPVAFYFGLAATLTFSEYLYPRLRISNS